MDYLPIVFVDVVRQEGSRAHEYMCFLFQSIGFKPYKKQCWDLKVSWNVQVFQRSLKGGNNPMKAEFNSFLLLVAMASNLVAMAST